MTEQSSSLPWLDKLKTANFEAGSVTTTILEAEAVTAEKLKVDNATY
ncbi:pblB domain protein [Streptococcus pneumoniae GA47502]|nr:pblB domain protein [Streptococcus pneumoniae GA47502]